MQEIINPPQGEAAAVAAQAAAELQLSTESCELVKRMDQQQAEALLAVFTPWPPLVLLAVKLRPQAVALLPAEWLQQVWPAWDCVLRFAAAQGEAGGCDVVYISQHDALSRCTTAVHGFCLQPFTAEEVEHKLAHA
jgi:hypothetical protein